MTNEDFHGIIYKLTVKSTGVFYIGATVNPHNFNGYWGSGVEWHKYLKDNNIPLTHEFIKKEIIDECFSDEFDMHDIECSYIRPYFIQDENGVFTKKPEYEGVCMNFSCTPNWANHVKCPECGLKGGVHTKECSKFLPEKECDECGCTYGHHTKECSHYTPPKECEECGGLMTSHYKFCSHYKLGDKCPHCDLYRGNHLKSCPEFKNISGDDYICPDCGKKLNGIHEEWCPRFKKGIVCPECEGKNGKHYTRCSQYKDSSKRCSKCGGKNGHHMKDCEDYKPSKCKECGTLNGTHEIWCSKFKPVSKCSECGLKGGHHKKDCPARLRG